MITRFLIRLWCQLFHRNYWHRQRYTDRSNIYVITECYNCRAQHGKWKRVIDEYKYE